MRRPLGAGLLVCAVLLVLAANYLSSDLHCEDAFVDGGSNHGEAEWSWVPLGTRCRWTEERHGIDRVDDPGWGPTIISGGMAVTGLALCATPKRRRSRHTAKPDAPES